ncbi:hypothetical protein KR059_012705, partial [Drosophila kikkawai]
TTTTDNKSKKLQNKSQKTMALASFAEEGRTSNLWDFNELEVDTLPDPEIAAMPIESQENELLSQLLYCFTGIRVSFIVPIPSDPDDSLAKYKTEFMIHKGVDTSLAELMRQALPLASHFVGIQKMMADMEGQGQVINALNAALLDVSQDFYHLINQTDDELARNQLTMQKLVYYMRPTIVMMQEIWTTLLGLRKAELRGAGVLTHLHGRIKRLEGDSEIQAVIIGLMRKAAEPYMRMLQLWIQKGVIVDRQQEFLVVDSEGEHCSQKLDHDSDVYWAKRYTLRKENTPSFLEKYSEKILRTGKYLNVVRQCGKRVMPTQQMHLEFDPISDQKHVSVINEAYYFSARMLMDVLLTENDLMGHLQSVKRYLLLSQGDFTMQFMDACEDELAKNVDFVVPLTLKNLLGMTLRISSARDDPHMDHLQCELLPYDLVTQMSKIMDKKETNWMMLDALDLTGLECFAFSYQVNWPVSLVLNHLAIFKYQMLFRQLFYCKHVERQLCKIWKENSNAKKASIKGSTQLFRSAFALRQRMLNAIQNLEYYMMIEIIEPNWYIFIKKMQAVENVDNVLQLHEDFIDSCLKNCMLSESSHLNRAIFEMCKVCLKFCEFIQLENFHKPANNFSDRVKGFDSEFTGSLVSFLKQIQAMAKENTAERFMNLVYRINFNGYYTDSMQGVSKKDA